MKNDKPENRNKKKPKGINKKIVLYSLLILTVFLSELFAYAWCRIQCIKTGYDIADENGKYDRELAIQEKLKTELEHLNSPNRIIQIAKTQLGLKMPDEGQIIQIQ